jgi:phosphatidylethanolamine/phosphatidyl-N-methylethanolamine N-methyltransferase
VRRHFIQEFIRNPREMGAIAPSSSGLAREMVSRMDLENAAVVVEYGPGTGAFTPQILARTNPKGLYFAIEQNSKMMQLFQQRFPQTLIFEDSVENVSRILDGLGRSEVDCIVSGLPWAIFPIETLERILSVTHSVLKPGGHFSTFAYPPANFMPSGRRLQKRLRALFSSVRKSNVVWRNLPPAFVYHCVK